MACLTETPGLVNSLQCVIVSLKCVLTLPRWQGAKRRAAAGVRPTRGGRAGPGCDSEPRLRYAVLALLASSRPSSVIDVSRILNFCTLPVTVIGNSAVSRTYRGIL